MLPARPGPTPPARDDPTTYFSSRAACCSSLATDGPGFAVDEDAAHLGEKILLLPWLEAHRAPIEQALPALAFNGPVHGQH